MISLKVGQFRSVYYGQFQPDKPVTSNPESGGQRNRILQSMNQFLNMLSLSHEGMP